MARNHVATKRLKTIADRAARQCFGFRVHDVSRLLSCRFERGAAHRIADCPDEDGCSTSRTARG